MSGITKLIDSFRVALVGIEHAAGERNMRIQIFLMLCVITAGFYFRVAIWEWCLITLSIGLVLSAELFNTAIEELADVVRDQNHLSREATRLTRDIAAGAVLLASISSLVIGLLIFMPKIFA